ncbi:short-chain dehydrogenase [Pyrococcus furiosus DSM 3638]|uniref:Short-chain dehydrogenase n=3 Tax=Pyrococcus furiosus TaxID=2261 RepID=A0A5C0XMJ9_PYRFU|nr:SDR family oxidoreductase [Pyrococcus furiosus]AAL80273.1 putative alcohol dehydrogenase/reductase [Pyrococcus furiosus DSM 3638]AFN04427.1 short chain dehydrogenase [Pyrococcus furiosus COM1]QEK77879.1 short-chain dehydrogenase [Pyrococcus furiosus DSM 3638]
MLKIDLSGKLAFTTASSKGIGFGVAKVLAMAGADVIILSRNEENLKKAKEKIKEIADVNVEYIVADLTKKEDLERIVGEVKNIGDPDIFFYSTGGPKPGYFMEMTMEDWEEAVKLLLYPAVYLTRALVPGMEKKGFGRIIYSTSVAIKEPIPNIALSNVVRISLAGLVRTLAKELGPKGITVNGIMPGIIRTDRVIQLAQDKARREGKSLEEALQDYAKPIPLGRLGEPEEIGYLVAFLSSELGSYINGAMIPVDGGRLNSVF